MEKTGERRNRPLEAYRAYLSTLARIQLSTQWRGKLDASDIVQQTILRAHTAQDTFRGETEAEWLSWLRTVLANVLCSVAREFETAARDVNRELSLEAALEESSSRLERVLTSDQSSPSHAAMRAEDLITLTQALVQLPDEQRIAVELHHLKGLTVSEVATELGRSRASVVGLLFRGLKRLRELLARVSEDCA